VARNEARQESADLKEMIRQMMTYNNNNNNNNSTSTSTSTSQTVVNSAEKRKHVAKTTSTIPEDKDMTSPDHRKQRQTSALEYNTQQPIALNFEQIREDINMDTGGNDDELSVNNSMCTAETPTVIESEEELSITDIDFTNNNMECTSGTVPTTITATDLSNGDFTPVRNGSPNRQATQERRNTTTTNNNSYSALQTTSTTKESNNNNNNNNTNAKDRQDHNNE
jgi:hypothetical protein